MLDDNNVVGRSKDCIVRFFSRKHLSDNGVVSLSTVQRTVPPTSDIISITIG